MEDNKRTLDARSIWAQTSSHLWGQMLQHFAAEGRWRRVGGKVVGLCPYHQEVDPGAFAIHPDKGFAKCLSARCQAYESDPVALFAQVMSLPYMEALRVGFIEYAALKLNQRVVADIQTDKNEQAMKEALMSAAVKTLTNAVNHPSDKEYAYCSKAVRWLTERGVDMSQLGRLPLGVLPTRRHLESAIEDKDMRARVRAYVNDRQGKEEKADLLPANPADVNQYVGGVVFPYHKGFGQIARFKLKSLEEGVEPIWIGPPTDGHGAFGMGLYRAVWGSKLAENCWAVEGEMDTISSYQALLGAHGVTDMAIIGLSGSGMPNLGFLAGHGVKRLVVVPDYDDGGTGFARLALERARGLKAGVFAWHRSPFLDQPGVDPDDVIHKLQRGTTFLSAIADTALLTDRAQWVFEAISMDLGRINSDARHDVEEIQEVLVRYHDTMRSQAVRDTVFELLRKDGLVPEPLLKSNKAARASEAEFLELVRAQLEAILTPVAYDGPKGYLYAKKTGALVEVLLTRRVDCVTTLAQQALNMTPFEWLRDIIGVPQWFSHVTKPDGTEANRPVMQQTLKADEYVYEATKQMCARAPDLSTMELKAQGLHFVDLRRTDPTVPEDERFRVLLVNGKRVYHAVLEPEDDLLVYEELDQPIIGNILCQPSGEPWDPFINLKALNEPTMVTLKEVFDRILALLIAGWSFSAVPEHHRLMATYLSAYIMYAGIASLFDTKAQVYLNGPPQCGKSSFLMGLLCGVQQPLVRLVYASRGWEDWSAAGIMQAHNRSTLLACLDEFESPERSQGSRKAKESQLLLEYLRGNINRGVEGVRGTSGGSAQTRKIDMPVAGAGVHPFTEEVDFSRWDIHQFKKKVGECPAPWQVILNMIGETGVRALARDISLTTRQMLPELYRNYHELRAARFFQTGFPPGIEPRYVDCLMPILAVLKASGVNVEAFFTEYLAYKSTLRAQYVAPDSDKLLDDILYTAAIRLSLDLNPGSKRTLASVLSDPGRREDLNTTSCGVYYLRSHEVVVFHCAQVLANLLQESARHRGAQDAKSLRIRLEQNETFMTLEEMKRLKLAAAVRPLVGVGRVTYNDIVAAKLSDLIGSEAFISGGEPDDLAHATDSTEEGEYSGLPM